MEKYPTCRFWFNDCKFSLKPGQVLNHYQGEPTDEGFSFEAFTLRHEFGVVTASVTTGGRDCDGTIENYYDLILTMDGWEIEKQSVYDQYAQMSNY